MKSCKMRGGDKPMRMRYLALAIAVLSALVAVALGIRAGTVGTGASLWHNLVVLVPSVLAVVGGIALLYSEFASTYILIAAILIFGLSENWIPMTILVIAGAIDFHFSPSPRRK